MNKKTEPKNTIIENYNEFVTSVSPSTNIIKSLSLSFIIGGITCVIGEGIKDIYTLIFPKMATDLVSAISLSTIIFIAILFTGLGFFDKIARYGGAGSFLPITGFANAMASASMEFRTEGLIFGTSVKMFSVVGPVVVNGVVWSTLAGIIHLILFGRI